jgi:hypothetical protein
MASYLPEQDRLKYAPNRQQSKHYNSHQRETVGYIPPISENKRESKKENKVRLKAKTVKEKFRNTEQDIQLRQVSNIHCTGARPASAVFFFHGYRPRSVNALLGFPIERFVWNSQQEEL